jgi:N-methylhydantoinase A
MTHALREVSIERGHDPRDFTFFAYGGTLPFFAVQMCRRLGCPEIVIPDNSAAFSAYGVLIADYVRAYDRTVNWNLAHSGGFARVNEAERQLRERAIADAGEEGLDPDLLTIEPSADFRFAGQDYELTMPLPQRDLDADDAERLAEEFLDAYERAYGKGTAWKGTPTIMVNYSIRAVHATAKPALPAAAGPAAWDAAERAAERHSVYLPEEKARTEVPVFAETSLTPGAFLEGPAIIQGRDTTVVLPADARATREANNGFRIAV